MGSGVCFCKATASQASTPAQKSPKTTIEPIAHSVPSALDFDRIRRYYEAQRDSMNRKTSTLYEKVLENKHREVSEIVIKLTNLRTVGARNLAVILMCYTHISTLKLWKTHLGAEGMSIIAAELPSMRSLSYLSLEDNQMEADGCQSLCKALPKLTSLQELWLPVNSITAKAAISLAEAISHCPELASVNLDENSIETNGFLAVLQSVTALPSLTNLSVAYNQITAEAVQPFCDFLTKTARKLKANLSGNAISQSDVQKITALAGASELIFA